MRPRCFLIHTSGAAADGAFRRDERQAVGAMRDAVAFPREIVVAFRHITRKRLHDGRRHGGQRRGVQNVKRPRLARRKVNLEKQFVGRLARLGGINL